LLYDETVVIYLFHIVQDHTLDVDVTATHRVQGFLKTSETSHPPRVYYGPNFDIITSI